MTGLRLVGHKGVSLYPVVKLKRSGCVCSIEISPFHRNGEIKGTGPPQPSYFPESEHTRPAQGRSGKERNDETGVDTTTYQDSRCPGRVMA